MTKAAFANLKYLIVNSNWNVLQYPLYMNIYSISCASGSSLRLGRVLVTGPSGIKLLGLVFQSENHMQSFWETGFEALDLSTWLLGNRPGKGCSGFGYGTNAV